MLLLFKKCSCLISLLLNWCLACLSRPSTVGLQLPNTTADLSPGDCRCRRQALGLPEHVKLLPESAAEKQQAQVALMQQGGVRFEQNWQNKRQKILHESIFERRNSSRQATAAVIAPSPPATSRSAGRGSASGRSGDAPSRRNQVLSAKEQLQQRLLAAKRKKHQL